MSRRVAGGRVLLRLEALATAAGAKQATFSGAHADKAIFRRNELPLFPRWDAGRLDALEAPAIAWLEPAATE